MEAPSTPWVQEPIGPQYGPDNGSNPKITHTGSPTLAPPKSGGHSRGRGPRGAGAAPKMGRASTVAHAARAGSTTQQGSRGDLAPPRATVPIAAMGGARAME
eukprot:19165-Pyramimonas_sp.AAC.1